LIELDGMETINTGLKNTRIHGEGDMNVDLSPEPPVSRTLEAKRKALSQFVCFFLPYYNLYPHSWHQAPSTGIVTTGTLSLQEAIALERQAYIQGKEREERIADKKRRLGMPVKGEILTRKEREARIWAFM
jgi:hypothetical protein